MGSSLGVVRALSLLAVEQPELIISHAQENSADFVTVHKIDDRRAEKSSEAQRIPAAEIDPIFAAYDSKCSN
jgi:hypothetical protein